jgi:release factor family 3
VRVERHDPLKEEPMKREMVTRRTVEELARVKASPAVSIFVSTDRGRPGDPAAPRRLRALVDRARERVMESWPTNRSAELLDRLERVGADIDWEHPQDSVALFATSEEDHRFFLPVAVEDRVVVEQTFATRELLLSAQRSTRYRVLVLSDRRARLFEGWGTDLDEVIDGEFPVDVDAPMHTGAPHRDLPVHERADGAHRFVYRTVDRLLNARTAHDPLPIVVVAPERDLAYYDDVSAHERLIVARVPGNHTYAGAHAIGALVAPHVERALVERHNATVGAIDRAAGQHRVELGPEAIWDTAIAGRGELLVVEDGFRYPARVVDGRLVPPDGTHDRFVVDDAVDEMIEAVLLHGGDAVIVEPGQLGDYAPIALARRY